MQLHPQHFDLDALADKVAGRIIDRLAECHAELPSGQVDELLDEIAAAEFLGRKPSTLTKWRQLNKGPAFVKVGEGSRAAVRYARTDLLRWAAARRVDPGLAGDRQ